MNTQFGVIFKDDDDDIWLGKYENGTVRDFGSLSDFEGIYYDMELTKFAFVEIKNGENDQVSIRDICKFELGEEPEPGSYAVPVTRVLEELDFPSESSDAMFGGFLQSAGKAN